MPPADAAKDGNEIAWAAGVGGVATGLCSACACGWVPFFGVPVVALATAAGAAGGGIYGAKDKPGWVTAILVDAGIAGAGGLIGAGLGTALAAGVTTFAMVSNGGQPSSPMQQPLILGAAAGALVLSAAGAVGGAMAGAYAIGAFAPEVTPSRDAAPGGARADPR